MDAFSLTAADRARLAMLSGVLKSNTDKNLPVAGCRAPDRLMPLWQWLG
ncbi:MAG: hypothetical protein ACYC6Q_05630 [Syntrophales bacterium]